MNFTAQEVSCIFGNTALIRFEGFLPRSKRSVDMALARAEGAAQRFYSLSAQVQRERKQYYDQLEATQRGTLDVTPWLDWFLACLLRAVQGADGMLGKLTNAKWAGSPL